MGSMGEVIFFLLSFFNYIFIDIVLRAYDTIFIIPQVNFFSAILERLLCHYYDYM